MKNENYIKQLEEMKSRSPRHLDEVFLFRDFGFLKTGSIGKIVCLDSQKGLSVLWTYTVFNTEENKKRHVESGSPLLATQFRKELDEDTKFEEGLEWLSNHCVTFRRRAEYEALTWFILNLSQQQENK